MEGNCLICKHCKLIESFQTLGGLGFVTNYQCVNSLSESFNAKMNRILTTGNTMDSREYNTCDKFEK